MCLTFHGGWKLKAILGSPIFFPLFSWREASAAIASYVNVACSFFFVFPSSSCRSSTSPCRSSHPHADPPRTSTCRSSTSPCRFSTSPCRSSTSQLGRCVEVWEQDYNVQRCMVDVSLAWLQFHSCIQNASQQKAQHTHHTRIPLQTLRGGSPSPSALSCPAGRSSPGMSLPV